MAVCRVCQRDQPTSAFYAGRRGRPCCKDCIAAARRALFARRPELGERQRQRAQAADRAARAVGDVVYLARKAKNSRDQRARVRG